MKLIVLDEKQERMIQGWLSLLLHNDMKEASRELIQDMVNQLEHNVVSAEDIEKILDAGIDIKA